MSEKFLLIEFKLIKMMEKWRKIDKIRANAPKAIHDVYRCISVNVYMMEYLKGKIFHEKLIKSIRQH